MDAPAAAHVEIALIESPEDCALLARVLADVWGFAESSAVASPDTLRAMTFSGCYVAGARVDGQLIGGGFGWPTHVDLGAGGSEWRLHSHVIGFLEGFRSLGIGALIKHHQRDFVRGQGLAAIEWTYDPLHAANARFNLAKLGARVTGFHNDFYGRLEDEFSAGLGSDRFTVRWGVDDVPPAELVVAEDLDRLPILAVGGDGGPVVTEATGSKVFAELPPNIVEIRKSNKALALEWRDAFDSTVGREVTAGGRVLGVSRDLAYLIDRPT
ncbi:MAG: family N-acetyltransferase [Ilumatobacteraceae bacterium]|nr:family N-acetyltransferase [Ilumatobacteraceae bacterium]